MVLLIFVLLPAEATRLQIRG